MQERPPEMTLRHIDFSRHRQAFSRVFVSGGVALKQSMCARLPTSSSNTTVLMLQLWIHPMGYQCVFIWSPLFSPACGELNRVNRLQTGNRESPLSTLSLSLLLVIDHLKNMMFYHTTYSRPVRQRHLYVSSGNTEGVTT